MATTAHAAGRSPRAIAQAELRSPRLFITAGLLLGLGLGGFLDGIVLHQLLQWHHLLTAEGSFPADTVPSLEDNILADGLFFALAWTATVLGIVMLWRSAPAHDRRLGWALLGLIAAGWGLFNLVESVVDHHILTLHHVRDDVADPLPWDLAFLALGAVLLAAGAAVARYGLRQAHAPGSA